MLQIKDIRKVYKTGPLVQRALDTVPFLSNPSLEEILEADRLARLAAEQTRK